MSSITDTIVNSNNSNQINEICVLISGNGSNLQALIDASLSSSIENLNPQDNNNNTYDNGNASYKISLVVSNRKQAFGLERAAKANIPTLVFTMGSFKRNCDAENYRELYDDVLANKIVESNGNKEPHLIVLAGFMHILSPAFLNKFKCPIINLHPALPGQFDGIHAIERAYQAFQEKKIAYTGIMVHHVIPQVDAGDVILQKRVDILESDKLEDLEERIHKTEHELIVQATKKILNLL